MLDGERSVEIKMMAHGGYAVTGTVSVPVTFHNGSFSAQLNLSALYTAGKAEKGRYYLQISPIETGLTAGTNVFVLNKSVTPQPAPTPTAGPTAVRCSVHRALSRSLAVDSSRPANQPETGF